MKKLACIFVILLITSCKNESVKSMIETPLEHEALEDNTLIEVKKLDTESFLYEELSTVKLQELYDLIALKQEHPEFEESIDAQLKNYLSDTLTTASKTEGLIKNIELKGELIEISDSVQKMKLYYDVVSNNSIQKDSIWAEVTTNEISVNGKKTQSKKIKFRTNPY